MDNDIYKAPQSNLVDEGEADAELASRLSRLVASILDGIVMMIFILPLMYFTGFFENIEQGVEPSFYMTLLVGGAGLLAFFIVNGSLLVHRGQTIGKKALGIKIVDMDGNLPAVKAHLLPRYATYFVPGYIPLIGSILSLVNIVFIFGKQKRCVHDLVAGTRVVNS